MDKRCYVDIFRESSKKKGSEPLKEDKQKLEIKKNEEDECALRKSSETHNNDLKRPTSDRRPPMPMYQSFFLAMCYAYNNYGHKAIEYKSYAQNRNTWNRNVMRTLGTRLREVMSERHLFPLTEPTTDLEH